ncbi:MAG: PIN domain-containing protein [Candidatus Korobacteraceae bacterium]
MKLFIDTSVLLAAAGSEKGASRFLFEQATVRGWALITTRYCLEEAQRNAAKVGHRVAATLHESMVPKLAFVPTELAFDKVLVFPKAKDRPVLLSALGAESDYLLTLDEGDFQKVIGSHIYGMGISTPGLFLIAERKAGRI